MVINHERFDYHTPMRDRVETDLKLMHEMKTDLNRYLTKWM